MVNFKNNYSLLLFLFISTLMVINLLVINKVNASDTNKNQQHSQQTRDAQLIKKSKLYQQANNQSNVIETISAGVPVVVHNRERSWYFVATEQKLTGWLSMLNVRFSGVAKRTSKLGVASAFNSLSKNTLPTQSTGIRGFDEADLKRAKADFKQLALVNAFQISPSQVKAFARQGQLKTNKKIEVK